MQELAIQSSERARAWTAVLVIFTFTLFCSSLVIAGDEGNERSWDEQVLIDNGVGTKARAVRRVAELSENFEVQSAAMNYLTLKRDRKAVAILSRILSSEADSRLLQRAALGLTQLGNEAGMRAIREELLAEDSDWTKEPLGWMLARDLAEAGDSAGYDLVLRLLDSPHYWERRHGVRALSSFVGFDECDAIDRLVSYARDSDPVVRGLAVGTFPNACSNGASATLLLDTLDDLNESDSEPSIRRQAGAVALVIRTTKTRQMACMANQ